MSGEVNEGAFDALLALQDLDVGLAQAVHRRATLPELGALDGALAAEAALIARRDALDADARPLRARRDELDAQAEALSTRRRSLEARMYADRGAARDLAALNDEVAHLTARLTVIEDQELEVMEELEPLDAGIAAIDQERAKAQAIVTQHQAAAEVATAVVDREIAELRAVRTTHAARVPGALLEQYEQIRRRAGGVGAARLVGDRCSGCHLTLSAVEVDQVRHQRPGSVHTCEQCGRILVAVPHAGPSSAGGEDLDGEGGKGRP